MKYRCKQKDWLCMNAGTFGDCQLTVCCWHTNEPELSDEAICSIMENDMLYERMERLDEELIEDWEKENEKDY